MKLSFMYEHVVTKNRNIDTFLNIFFFHKFCRQGDIDRARLVESVHSSKSSLINFIKIPFDKSSKSGSVNFIEIPFHKSSKSSPVYFIKISLFFPESQTPHGIKSSLDWHLIEMSWPCTSVPKKKKPLIEVWSYNLAFAFV